MVDMCIEPHWSLNIGRWSLVADLGVGFHKTKGHWRCVDGAREGFQPFMVFDTVTLVEKQVGECKNPPRM